MKCLCLLGATGSIGRNTLQIVDMFPEAFVVKALSAKTSVELLARQIEKYRPDIAVVIDKEQADKLARLLPGDIKVEILYGLQGYIRAATHAPVDMVVSAVVGAAGLLPTLAAIEAGKQIALANKETLVMAGDIVMQKAAEQGVDILPVDSEHSAIFQCLSGHRRQDLEKILLTASGGPFLNKPATEFSKVTPQEALDHPTWRMGRKISVDSATLMNKGLEVIEAQHLFGIPADRIEVVIHPQSLIHSMVAYCDGSVIAQIGIPDMKGAIAYALSHPARLSLKQPIPDFADIGRLVFLKPEAGKFPCLELAYTACRGGGTLPAVLNAANEEAVYGFLEHRLSFTEIPRLIDQTMENHAVISQPGLDDILAADAWARRHTREAIEKLRA